MKRFTNILFVVEPGSDDAAAFEQALTLATNNQARITVAAVIKPPDKALTLRKAMVEEQQERLGMLVQSAAASKVDIETKVLLGVGFVEIIREVLRNKRDLVVKSAERMGHRVFGGTDMKLLRKCPCPVWAIQSAQQKGYREILVALDYDPENPENEPLNRQLLEMASSLAVSEFAELHVVHAWNLDHEAFYRARRSGMSEAEVDVMVKDEEHRRHSWLTRIVGECCTALGAEAAEYLDPQLHLVKGHPRTVVPSCANELGAELVVMGSVGRTGIPGFIMGNTAEDILAQIESSVLVVKPAGFVSPVS